MAKKQHNRNGAPSSLSFADLGLRTQMPSILTQSREQSQRDKAQKKKDTKARMQLAVEQVAATRAISARHKELAAETEALERRQRAERKRELSIVHSAARTERETEAKRRQAESAAANVAYANKLSAEKRAETAASAEVRALLEKEKAEEIGRTATESVHIPIHRTASIEAVRRELPVVREEQAIVEAIHHTERSCVLICGETGSGKTTQVPQFLWEAGYGHAQGSSLGREGTVLVTEPRRVAAVSMAKRVAEELNVTFGGEVCYQVRYDHNLSDHCKIKFVTEGIVLNEIQSDFLLRRYSCIIVDEAHERSIACDILIGLLSRIAPLRNDMHREELARVGGDAACTTIKPLRLVIMSATLRINDFRDNPTLFPIRPQLIDVEARRFKVTNHFARRTEIKEYVDEAFDKVRQVHKKLPPGGILVFLCTQQEIESLCDRLRRYYAKTRIEYYDDAYHKQAMLRGADLHDQHVMPCSSDSNLEDGKNKATKKKCTTEVGGTAASQTEDTDEFGLQSSDYALDVHKGVSCLTQRGRRADVSEERIPCPKTERLNRHRMPRAKAAGGRGKQKERDLQSNRSDDDEEEGDMNEEVEEDGNHDEDDEVNGEYSTLHVLPMYALLDFQQQQEVFKPPPHHQRLCIVATNIAETSITIPNIRYVVDAGRVKSRTTDSATKASCFRIGWTSQASAEQRSGRAGRVGPGHCYRLYSTAVYTNLMPRYATPEILRTPLEAVVLLMKHIGIDHVSRFPFPASPPLTELHTALIHLSALGALHAEHNYAVTKVGRALLHYPVAPRFARVLYEAQQRRYDARLTAMVMAIVAILSTTTSVFTSEGNRLRSTKSKTAKSHDKDGTDLTVAGSAALLSSRDTGSYMSKKYVNLSNHNESVTNEQEETRRQHVKSLMNNGTDLVTFLNAFIAYMTERNACVRYCLVQKNMYEAKLLYYQLQRLSQVSSATTMKPPHRDGGAEYDKDDHDGVLQSLETNDDTTPEESTWTSQGGSNKLCRARSTGEKYHKDATGDGTLDDAVAEETEADGAKAGDSVSLRSDKEAREVELQLIRLAPTRADELALRQLFIVGLIDQVARRASVHECRTYGAEYCSKTSKVPYLILNTRTIAYVHPSSSVSNTCPPPEYVIFAFLQRVARSEAHPERTTMLGVTIVTLEWLHLCGYSEEHAMTATSAQEDKVV